MLLHLARKYFFDISLIALSCAIVFGVTVAQHGVVKPYTRELATVAPLVFAFASLALLAVIGLGAKRPLVKRLAFDLSVASLFIPLAMLKAEMAIMPAEYFHGAGVEEVTERIASNDDFKRYRAWARLVTMSKDDKDEVARRVAALLTSDDAGARASARLTLDVALRKHLMAALTTLSPTLEHYLAGTGDARDREHAELAGEFARDFVEGNVTAIRKAIDPKQRMKLPPGGLEALVLALAADDELGEPFLRDLALSQDEELKPLAANALKLKGHGRSGH
jgi:hypothetical protein